MQRCLGALTEHRSERELSKSAFSQAHSSICGSYAKKTVFFSYFRNLQYLEKHEEQKEIQLSNKKTSIVKRVKSQKTERKPLSHGNSGHYRQFSVRDMFTRCKSFGCRGEQAATPQGRLDTYRLWLFLCINCWINHPKILINN